MGLNINLDVCMSIAKGIVGKLIMCRTMCMSSTRMVDLRLRNIMLGLIPICMSLQSPSPIAPQAQSEKLLFLSALTFSCTFTSRLRRIRCDRIFIFRRILGPQEQQLLTVRDRPSVFKTMKRDPVHFNLDELQIGFLRVEG